MLTAAEWEPPFDLQRGREYAWQVESTVNGVRRLDPHAPDPPVRFRVLDEAAANELAKARREHPDDALLYAALAAQYGLREETLTALEQLARTDRSLAESLRASVEQWPSRFTPRAGRR